MEVMAFFSIHPIGKGEHVGEPVARAVRVIRDSGLEHELGASGTTIVGEWDDVMACIKACHEAVAADAPRVSSLIKVDLKTHGHEENAIRGKVERVEQILAGNGPRPAKAGKKGPPLWKKATKRRA